jgi:hypothetical protein
VSNKANAPPGRGRAFGKAQALRTPETGPFGEGALVTIPFERSLDARGEWKVDVGVRLHGFVFLGKLCALSGAAPGEAHPVAKLVEFVEQQGPFEQGSIANSKRFVAGSCGEQFVEERSKLRLWGGAASAHGFLKSWLGPVTGDISASTTKA